MKKAIALFVALLMVVLSVNVSADTVQTEKINKILLSVKERIGSTEEYTDFNSGVSEYSSKTVYRFEWSKEDDEGRFSSMNVSTDGDGIILSYNAYDYTEVTEVKPAIKGPSKDKAMKKAKELIDRLNPDLSGELKLENKAAYESLYLGEHNFDIQRYVNGIPVMGDNGYITISEDMSRITYFNINYTKNLTFENEKEIISRDKAVEAFGKNIGLKLCYVNTYKDKQNTLSLRYVPEKTYNIYIDAVTGEAVQPKQNEDNYNYKYSANDAAVEQTSATGGVSLSRAEISELEKVDGLLGEDEIKNIIYSTKILGIDKDYTVESSSLNRHYRDNDKYIYSYSFAKNVENKRLWKDASLDARTGEILSYYGYHDYADKENKISGEEALKKAEEAVLTLAPRHFKLENCEFKLSNEISDDTTSFVYTRYPNGVEFSGNYVRVGINPYDGSLLNYSIQYDNFDFPSPDGVLDMNTANIKLFEQIPYNVWYMPNGNEAIKVYSYENANPAIDANTGKLIASSYETKPIKYNDIENHYAKAEIETLARYGVGFEEESFMPDSFITQKDFVSLVNAVFYDRGPVVITKDYDSTSAYRYLNNRGVIKTGEYNPDGHVTREMAAKMLIRGMGLEQAAECSNIFIPLYKDVTGNIGYTSILGAMGVINGDENGCFNPQATLTRADAIIMLYNYLVK